MKRKGRSGVKGKGRVELEQSWGGLETHQFLDSAAQARAKLNFLPFLMKLCQQLCHTLPLDCQGVVDEARAGERFIGVKLLDQQVLPHQVRIVFHQNKLVNFLKSAV